MTIQRPSVGTTLPSWIDPLAGQISSPVYATNKQILARNRIQPPKRPGRFGGRNVFMPRHGDPGSWRDPWIEDFRRPNLPDKPGRPGRPTRRKIKPLQEAITTTRPDVWPPDTPEIGGRKGFDSFRLPEPPPRRGYDPNRRKIYPEPNRGFSPRKTRNLFPEQDRNKYPHLYKNWRNRGEAPVLRPTPRRPARGNEPIVNRGPRIGQKPFDPVFPPPPPKTRPINPYFNRPPFDPIENPNEEPGFDPARLANIPYPYQWKNTEPFWNTFNDWWHRKPGPHGERLLEGWPSIPGISFDSDMTLLEYLDFIESRKQFYQGDFPIQDWLDKINWLMGSNRKTIFADDQFKEWYGRYWPWKFTPRQTQVINKIQREKHRLGVKAMKKAFKSDLIGNLLSAVTAAFGHKIAQFALGRLNLTIPYSQSLTDLPKYKSWIAKAFIKNPQRFLRNASRFQGIRRLISPGVEFGASKLASTVVRNTYEKIFNEKPRTFWNALDMAMLLPRFLQNLQALHSYSQEWYQPGKGLDMLTRPQRQTERWLADIRNNLQLQIANLIHPTNELTIPPRNSRLSKVFPQFRSETQRINALTSLAYAQDAISPAIQLYGEPAKQYIADSIRTLTLDKFSEVPVERLLGSQGNTIGSIAINASPTLKRYDTIQKWSQKYLPSLFDSLLLVLPLPTPSKYSVPAQVLRRSRTLKYKGALEKLFRPKRVKTTKKDLYLSRTRKRWFRKRKTAKLPTRLPAIPQIKGNLELALTLADIAFNFQSLDLTPRLGLNRKRKEQDGRRTYQQYRRKRRRIRINY